jgi:hypothetical protein
MGDLLGWSVIERADQINNIALRHDHSWQKVSSIALCVVLQR